jgi:hypothetical protein
MREGKTERERDGGRRGPPLGEVVLCAYTVGLGSSSLCASTNVLFCCKLPSSVWHRTDSALTFVLSCADISSYPSAS